MGREDEIRSLIAEGYSPISLIKDGYAKSTVYKIYNETKSFTSSVRKINWIVENISLNKERFLPGETINVSFDLRNLVEKDLYVVSVGIQSEWMKDEGKNNYWISQKINDILKPMQKISITIRIQVPAALTLGEYQIRFGLEGQYLPITNFEDQSLDIKWSMPHVLQIKFPLSREKIFLSHSVQDKRLVREIHNYLDNHGYSVIIGEDETTPGKLLTKKFEELIDSSSVFVCLLTEPALLSKWVKMEIDYAIKVNKPWILLKEKSLPISSDYEWIEFDKSSPTPLLIEKIIHSINKIKLPIDPSIGILLGVALAGFFLGWSLRK